MLLDNVEFWTVRRKIVHAQRFAAPAAKPPDGFSLVPWRVINEQDKTRVLLEQDANKADEGFLCLSCNKTEGKRALRARADDVKAFARVVRLHDGTTAFQRPTPREVGRDDDRAFIHARDRPSAMAVEGADAFCFFLNRCCAFLSAL